MICNNSNIVTIKKLINGGYGLAHSDSGKTVLVRHALPGETVEIKITGRLEQLDYADIVAVKEYHSNRIAPPCRYYGSCGGCNLQHADYPTQASIKQHILEDLLARNASHVLKALSSQVLPTIASPLHFGYRQRIRFTIDSKGTMGFNRFRSHTVIPITRCLLAHKNINTCLKELLASSLFQDIIRISEELQILLNPINETIFLLFTLRRRSRPKDRSTAHSLCKDVNDVRGILFRSRDCATEGPFSADETKADCRLHLNLPGSPALVLSWEAGGFCQVNSGQNRNLVALVLELCMVSQTDRILDLYCGMGNFALPVARYAKHVHGIESQGSAIRSARHNSIQNRLANTSFQKADVGAACRTLVERGEVFDTIICDPPRQGLTGLAPALYRLANKRLIYISCDPATLCRDLAQLCEEGFSITSLQPIDMFPQTHHIETVVLLEKN